MKQIFKALVLVAAAVATLTSCEKAPEVSPAPEEFTLTVNATLPAPDGTKTYLGDKVGNAYPVLWSEDDKIRVSQVPYYTEDGVEFAAAGSMSSPYSTSIVRSADNTTATFEFDSFTDPDDSANFIDYLAIYGGSGYNTYKRTANYVDLVLTLPTTQTPAAGQFDPKAAIMGATVLGTTKTQSSLDLNFEHLAAYAMLNVKGLVCGTETIQSVTITSDNHKIAGQSYWYYLEGTKYSAAGSASYEINVNLASQSVTNSDFEAYFAAIPTVFAAGDKLTFEVTTDANRYVKEVTITAETAFSLAQGQICDFSVDFSGIVAEAPVVGTNYQLVTDVSSLAAGDEIIIVANNSGTYYAASSVSSQKFTTITVNPTDNVITVSEDTNVNVFTLGKEGDYWTLKASIEGKYITNTGSNTNVGTVTSVAADNDGSTEDEIVRWSIVENDDTNTFKIINKNSSRPLLLQKSSSAIRPYASSNVGNSGYVVPAIYEKL